jgi:hypothetical protein
MMDEVDIDISDKYRKGMRENMGNLHLKKKTANLGIAWRTVMGH